MVNNRGFAHILLVIFLLLGIAVTVYLVGQQTNLLPKAAFLPPSQVPETSLSLVSSFERLPDPVPLFNSAAQSSGGVVAEPIKVKLFYKVGDVIPVALLTRSDIDEANLFAAKLKFDKDLLEVVSVKIPDIPVSLPDSIARILLIKNWVEQTFDQNEGTISLVGGVPAPGYKTSVKDYPGLMTLILFKAKKAGSATISLTDQSQILRNSDNINILTAKRDTTISIQDEVQQGSCPSGKYWDGTKCVDTPPSLPSPTPIPPSPTSPPPPSQKGDGNTDGKVNLIDMSVLLTDFNKEKGYREPVDMNGDGKINTFDFSMHRCLLTDLGVIKGTKCPNKTSP